MNRERFEQLWGEQEWGSDGPEWLKKCLKNINKKYNKKFKGDNLFKTSSTQLNLASKQPDPKHASFRIYPWDGTMDQYKLLTPSSQLTNISGADRITAYKQLIFTLYMLHFDRDISVNYVACTLLHSDADTGIWWDNTNRHIIFFDIYGTKFDNTGLLNKNVNLEKHKSWDYTIHAPWIGRYNLDLTRKDLYSNDLWQACLLVDGLESDEEKKLPIDTFLEQFPAIYKRITGESLPTDMCNYYVIEIGGISTDGICSPPKVKQDVQLCNMYSEYHNSPIIHQ
jgi:hypothetical protein